MSKRNNVDFSYTKGKIHEAQRLVRKLMLLSQGAVQNISGYWRLHEELRKLLHCAEKKQNKHH